MRASSPHPGQTTPFREMPFVRGVFGHCADCGAELNVAQLRHVERGSENARLYSGVCRCGAPYSRLVPGETHEASVAYLEQVAQSHRARDEIAVPLSEQEKTLWDFVAKLDQVGSPSDLW